MRSRAVIERILADEILDSRGNPTVEVSVTLSNGVTSSASVPSGASTGEFEAVELRDRDPKRYGGKGVLAAVRHVNEEIAWALTGMRADEQRVVDEKLIEVDGALSRCRDGRVRSGDEECKIALPRSSLSGCGHQLRRTLVFPVSAQPA
ncbi:phosphopyruvate hydratase family protein [Paraburkholderia sediminicola]|uniref:hypothetical protein n=1 Tax=Paraburkholderia sediminicola TaxID=458836 RepID=UPI0038B8436E